MGTLRRIAEGVYDPGARRLAVVVTTLHLATKLLVAAVALSVMRGVPRLIATTLGLAIVFGLLGVTRAALRRRVHGLLAEETAGAVLRSDAMRAFLLPEDDPTRAVVEGIYRSERLLYDVLPSSAGDAIAALLLTSFVVATRPPHIALVLALALALASLVVALARRSIGRITERTHRLYLALYGTLIAAIGARIELVASGQDDAHLEALRGRVTEWRRLSLRADGAEALATRASAAVVVLVVLAGVALGGSTAPWTARALESSLLLAAVFPPFAGLARGAYESVRLSRELTPIAALLSAGQAPPARARALQPGRAVTLPAPIALEGVSYAYPMEEGGTGRPVLTDLSFVWRPGRVLVLAGPNGAGKSTCVRLLLGLGHPTSGRITLGDTDLADADLRQLRRRIAYLAQRPYLQDRATVREAIQLIAPDADDAAIENALQRVGLTAMFVEPSALLDIKLGTLSIGQRQRVALARVLAQDAPVVLLDEPDANLDASGIELVAALVRELAATKMVAVVAHTPQMLAVADDVVQLGPGPFPPFPAPRPRPLPP